jgi:hypothetical protein
MGRQPWPDLAPWRRSWGLTGEEGEEGEGQGGTRGEGGLLGEEAPWGCRRSWVWAALVRSLLLLAVLEEEHVGGRKEREEREKEKRERGKERKK